MTVDCKKTKFEVPPLAVSRDNLCKWVEDIVAADSVCIEWFWSRVTLVVMYETSTLYVPPFPLRWVGKTSSYSGPHSLNTHAFNQKLTSPTMLISHFTLTRHPDRIHFVCTFETDQSGQYSSLFPRLVIAAGHQSTSRAAVGLACFSWLSIHPY